MKNFDFICFDKSYEINWIHCTQAIAQRGPVRIYAVIDTFRGNAASVISQIKVLRNLDLV